MASASASAARKARHCAELLATGPSLDALVPLLSRFGGTLSRTLAPALAPFVSGGSDNAAPAVSGGMPMDGNLASIDAEIETLALHSLLSLGRAKLPVLVTIGAGPLVALVDRAFGGAGKIPEPPPEALPLSAELLAGRLERSLAAALGAALDGPGGSRLVAEPVRRDTSLRQLAPFPASDDVLQLSFEVEAAGMPPWQIAFAFPLATLAAMLGDSGKAKRAPAPYRYRGAEAEPFDGLPLTLTATLVDMPIGFSRLARLAPGDLLPVAVARSIPLQVGDRTLAVGTLGELEDRVALQLHSVPQP